MNYPDFFNHIETIRLKDDLSLFLGAFENGEIEFSYLDLVKSAGHSCPTVLGAYLMTKEALKFLYNNELPKRGEVKVLFSQSQTEGTTGVIASVISNILGATKDTGFKGLGGFFDRRYLMLFDENITSSVRFIRRDTNKTVDVFYDTSMIDFDENMSVLMKKYINNQASEEEKESFRKMWQKRVEQVALNTQKVIRIEEVI